MTTNPTQQWVEPEEAPSSPAITETGHNGDNRGRSKEGLAQRLTEISEDATGVPFPLGLRAWDGSAVELSDLPTVVVRSPRAVRHVIRRPGELGLVRAYVTGDLDVDGDFRSALRTLRSFADDVRAAGPPKMSTWPRLLSFLIRAGAVGLPPAVPLEEARVRGRRHSRNRDRAVISHHYDLGNEFYTSILDQTMSYSCGYWKSQGTLADAQVAKLELICQKLALRPGARLLDVGCGWGALLLHAAEQYGVHATGVTLSERQREFVRAEADDRGLGNLVDVRLLDYRDLPADQFDAIASVEMGEHVGETNYPAYCERLRDRLRPRGRVLLQQMSRGTHAPGGGAFIEAYIAPDMTMRPLHRTLAHLEAAGLEARDVVSMREHYVRTIDAWARRLDEIWDDVLYRYGARRARIWRLYLTGVAMAFELNRMSVHQILAVRSDGDGKSGMALRPEWSTTAGTL